MARTKAIKVKRQKAIKLQQPDSEISCDTSWYDNMEQELPEAEQSGKTEAATDKPEIVANTVPLQVVEPQRNGKNGKNGKKSKVMKCRSLLFTDKPYGFREAWVEEAEVLAAGITPIKDDKGDIYLVVRKQNEAGEEVISRWPTGIEFPVVPSGKLDRAMTWDMIPIIAKSGMKNGWGKLSISPWVIVVIVLGVIFFTGFFGLFGGN